MGRFGVILQSIAAIPVAFYGYAFHKVWISASSVPLDALSSEVSPLVPASPLNALFAVALAVAVCLLGSVRLRRAGLPVGLASQLISLATVMAVSLAPLPSDAGMILLSAGSVLQAVGTIVLSALWIDLYARLNPVRAVFCNAIAVIVAQVLIFLTELNPPLRVFFMIALSALLAVACYAAALHNARREEKLERSGAESRGGDDSASAPQSPEGMRERFLFPYKAVLFIGAYSFAYGVAMPTVNTLAARYASVIPCTIVVLFILVNSKKFNLSVLFRLALPLMIVGFLLVTFIPGTGGLFSSTVINVGFSAMELLLVLMVCTISYGAGVPAIWLFAVLGAAQFAFRFAGVCLGGFLTDLADPTLSAVLYAGVVLLVVVVSLMLMTERSLFLFWRFHGERARGSAEGALGGEDREVASEDYLKIRVNSLSAAHSLTDREIEVLYLMVQGKTNLQIAHDMFISEGTVKAHLHHIYQKFGLHNRKELMALVREEPVR